MLKMEKERDRNSYTNGSSIGKEKEDGQKQHGTAIKIRELKEDDT